MKIWINQWWVRSAQYTPMAAASRQTTMTYRRTGGEIEACEGKATLPLRERGQHSA